MTDWGKNEMVTGDPCMSPHKGDDDVGGKLFLICCVVAVVLYIVSDIVGSFL